MKNELGIEICGENCKGDVIPNYDCPKCGQKKCGDENCQYFSPKTKLLKQRIKELQERVAYDDDYCEYLRNKIEKLESQQFTKEELHILRSILQAYFRVYTTQHYRTEPLLKKIESLVCSALGVEE